MTCCVYWIRLVNHTDLTKEGYIGISTDFDARMRNHLASSKKGKSHLYRAIRKYGWDVLIKQVLCISTVEYCRELEVKLRPSSSIGWNEIPGGDFSPSKNPDVAKKISEALKGKCFMEHTEESKAKIAEGNRRRILSEESKARIANACRENQKKRVELMNSKYTYTITHPNGSVEVINNLSEWCLKMGVRQANMLRVAQGKRNHHKGYHCKRVANSCEQEKLL